MKRARRNHTAVFKAKVALDAIKGEKTLAELSMLYDVHVNQITHLKTELISRSTEIFTTAAERKEAAGRPEIFNTDQGSQFTSIKFTQVLKNNHIQISMDGRGR